MGEILSLANACCSLLPAYHVTDSSLPPSCCHNIVYSHSEDQVPLEPSSETTELNTPFFPGHVSLGYFGHGDVKVADMTSVLGGSQDQR